MSRLLMECDVIEDVAYINSIGTVVVYAHTDKQTGYLSAFQPLNAKQMYIPRTPSNILTIYVYALGT